ncbi:hypothetical protein L208DRAFT_1410258 [Tricholoma matsutake]|nr:hypothetical protein L208DRAFT_1410258 [Tricholoma matsutake 945]
MHVYSILIGIIALPVYVVAVPTCRATKPVENISGYECYILSQIPVIIDQFGGVTGFSNLDVDHGRCKLPDSADVKASKDKNGSCYLGTDAGSQKCETHPLKGLTGKECHTMSRSPFFTRSNDWGKVTGFKNPSIGWHKCRMHDWEKVKDSEAPGGSCYFEHNALYLHQEIGRGPV